MFIQIRADGAGERVMTSASDLTAASACEFAFLRRVDLRLGRAVIVPPDDDAMLARAAELGDEHEERVLEEYRRELGRGSAGARGGVVAIPRCDPRSEADLAAAAERTIRALRGGADVVFQATFFDPAHAPVEGAADEPQIGFLGFADFLRRTADGAFEVQDAKLARRARVTALMQLAAYAEQLERLDVPVAGEAVLLLGDGARSRHRLADIAPVFRARRARLHRILRERIAARGADGRRESAAPVAWNADDIAACGRCEVCEPEVQRTRDPLLIAGIRRSQRDALVAAGLPTIDAIARADRSMAVPGVSTRALEGIAEQAAAQVATAHAGDLSVRVVDASGFAALPQPDEGDLFFDFEGDPMYREPDRGPEAGALAYGEVRVRWGLDYLFGMVDTQEQYRCMWAHDLDGERKALLDFLTFVAERRARYPGMRIYHYAAYERTHLLSIAARHGVGEAEVDRLLSEHVLVDLYPIVRAALRIGTRSYSIKQLEPLYMGGELRDQDGVTSGAESVTEYAEATAQLAAADSATRDEGRRRLESIADYNRYDCLSTLRLRDWLLGQAARHGVTPRAPEPHSLDEGVEQEPSAVAVALERHAERSPHAGDRQSIALAASAIDYHQREQKAFWWAHYARTVDPIEDWAQTRDVLVVDADSSRVVEDWHLPQRARVRRRRVLLRGEIAPGSRLRPGGEIFLLYAHPAPFTHSGTAPGARGARRARIVDSVAEGVLVEESAGDGHEYSTLPVAVTPGPPPPAGSQKRAIEEWGEALAAALDRGAFPRDPAVDLLRRSTPVFRSVEGRNPQDSTPGASGIANALDPAEPAEDRIEAVMRSVLALDRSALAIQGPPGTGKTTLAAGVIKRLVEDCGWRIGVTAQSHQVIEHVLTGVVAAGVDPASVGKVPQSGTLGEERADPGFTVLPRNGQAAFLASHRERGSGCVVGGTAWDLSNPSRFERGSLDLLIVDEAGQFALAPTIAASVSAHRILLLGDPQQLPQVSQGSHPEPIDTSALAWLLGDRETIPPGEGFFLAETRRLRPELSAVVSELAYGGRLRSHPTAANRVALNAGPPGLVAHPVSHRGNSTSSIEEAEAVVDCAQRLLRGRVRDGDTAERPVDQADIIVVAPYNAQVECVSEALAAAGLGRIRVGTVDRFQGQEAVFAIVTLAASSPEDAPRGLEFLLMRNRLNVAISRAQWSAHLIASDRLGDGLPTSPGGVAALSGYLRLIERAVAWKSEAD